MPVLKRYTNWRTTWTQIVPGHFGGPGPYNDLLFYDRSAGVGNFYTTDGLGNLTLLNGHTDWSADWDVIVAGNFGLNKTGRSDLLMYSRARNTAAFYSVSAQANITLLKEYTDWNNDWDIIVVGDFGGSSITGQSD